MSSEKQAVSKQNARLKYCFDTISNNQGPYINKHDHHHHHHDRDHEAYVADWAGCFFPPRPGKILKQALCVTTHYRLCATLKNTNYKAVKHNEENKVYSPLLNKNRSPRCFNGQYKICTPAHLSNLKYQNILLHRPSFVKLLEQLHSEFKMYLFAKLQSTHMQKHLYALQDQYNIRIFW